MKKFSFKSAPRTLTAEKRAMREQMLRAVPEELLSQIRGGGLEDGCHSAFCCCDDGCSLSILQG
ncbi:MAG TPA: hypothetical protein VF516_03825 [Kofleriaceae bacterium]